MAVICVGGECSKRTQFSQIGTRAEPTANLQILKIGQRGQHRPIRVFAADMKMFDRRRDISQEGKVNAIRLIDEDRSRTRFD